MKLKELFLLFLILLISAVLRFWRLSFPTQMYFDETYHVPAATMMAQGDFSTPFEWWHGDDWQMVVILRNYDRDGQKQYFDWLHPPLAKYFQALAIKNVPRLDLLSFYWRLPSVLISLLSILVFYFLAKFLAQNFLFKKKAKRQVDLIINFALLATILFSLDGLFLVQSRLAMNDVFLLFFTLIACLLYFYFLKERRRIKLLFLGLSLGLALASKWSAVFFLVAIFYLELWQIWQKKDWSKIALLIFSLIILPLGVYMLVYWPFFSSGKTLADFFLLQKKIWQFQLETKTHPYASSPLAWFFNARPVWYFFAHDDKNQTIQNIYALGNPIIFLYFWPAFAQLVWQKDNKRSYLLFFYLMAFLPWIFSPRIMFFYHYTPAIPWMILIITAAFFDLLTKFEEQWQRRALIFNFIFWPLFAFMLFYPHWTGLMVPETLVNKLYFFLPSWK